VRKHLGGWTRIGIVLSVVWFFGFAGYWWNFSQGEAHKQFELDGGMCLSSLDRANERPNADTAANWGRYQDCTKRAIATWQTAVVSTNEAIPALLIVSLISVGLWWLVIWGLAALIRWVHRGFAS
jgi:hypothetical protein